MILWTLQYEHEYDRLCRDGGLKYGVEHEITFPVFAKPYEWMMSQMRVRIGIEPEDVCYPIWAWYQWEGKRRRLDMRSHRCYGKPGERIVLLTIDVPNDKVLLSDFDNWHYVLNDVHFDLPEMIEETKEKSWEKILDLVRMAELENPNGLSIQATMWEIKKEWVKKVEFYKCKCE